MNTATEKSPQTIRGYKPSREAKYPSLDPSGSEIPDPKPIVAYLQVDPETGEVTGEGKMPRQTIQSRIQGIMDFSRAFDYGDFDDDDFEDEDTDGLEAPLSPHQEGFAEAMAPSDSIIRKVAKKLGKKVKEDLPIHSQSPTGAPAPTPSSGGDPSQTPAEGPNKQ